MNVLLWDTRQRDVSKDFAGGFGVGMYPGSSGLRSKIIRWFYRRDRRPAALLYAYLAAVFARLGYHGRSAAGVTRWRPSNQVRSGRKQP